MLRYHRVQLVYIPFWLQVTLDGAYCCGGCIMRRPEPSIYMLLLSCASRSAAALNAAAFIDAANLWQFSSLFPSSSAHSFRTIAGAEVARARRSHRLYDAASLFHAARSSGVPYEAQPERIDTDAAISRWICLFFMSILKIFLYRETAFRLGICIRNRH